MAVDVAAILHAFADLSPEGKARAVTLDVSRLKGLAWVGLHGGAGGLGFNGRAQIYDDAEPALLSQTQALATHDALHRHEQRLREGWVFVVGRTTIDGERREVCLPILSAPVRLDRPNAVAEWAMGRNDPQMPAIEWVRRQGDPEITSLVADPDQRADLEARAQFGGGGLDQALAEHLHRFPQLTSWIREVCAAADLRVSDVVSPSVDVLALRRRDDLVAVVGTGIYAVEAEDEPERRRTLRGWAARPGVDDTVLGTVYAGAHPIDVPDEPVRSPVPLTPAQREVVLRSRHEPLVVASGAPGTGKSHAVVALAIDAVLRGESVLIATQSHHAAEVLADMLDRHPGPTPLLFGNGERRTELLDELTERLGQPIRPREVEALDAKLASALDEVTAARHLLERSLEMEAAAASFERWEPSIPVLLSDVPGVFDARADLDAVAILLTTAEGGEPSGFFARRRHRADRRRLDELTRAAGVPFPVVRDALAAARARTASLALSGRGGISLDGMWDRLARAEDDLRAAIGARAGAHDRLPTSWTNTHRRAVSALLAALRAGRGQRRRLLAELDRDALTRGVPLWVGNLHDIEDLLPAIPGLFDLVVLDEASQIDQPYGALALLRGRRAVVVGDPRQLRHVSFTSDADVRTVLDLHGLDHLGDRLDLRRVSAFDAAAASAPVTWLDEHHRSLPHLIEFSARRFYRDRVTLLTRHPRVHGSRAIDVVPVDGERTPDGVNAAQVDAVMDLIDRLADEGETSVGVVTPFRPQADAIEAAIVQRLSLERITALGLRVGTVHAFQGGERDVVILSLALDDASPPGSRRFVEDPSLFNVMVTRARHRLVVLTSQSEPVGLVGDYLAWAESPPGPPPPGGHSSRWSVALGAELERAGLAVAHRYPVGSWHLDLVVGEGAAAVGVECGVHPDGPAAHIERHLTLTGAGWRIRDAFPSRWDNAAAPAAVELAPVLGGTTA
ncbi:MAG: DEAD/DEAH box helicase [Acidimicrobiales bacterium]